MNTDSRWCDDEDLLVRELRRAGRSHQPPHIAGYDNLRELRRGGQGVVFLARQLSTNRTVAIKLILDGTLASRDARRRFEREIELVANLRHPNVVRVYDSGDTEDGRMYYVMEFIRGVGLDEFIHGRSSLKIVPDLLASSDMHAAAVDVSSLFVGSAELLTMFAKVCDGVQHAHQQGVIHRDLKPSNVRIDEGGEPHVLDFGLAKLIDHSAETTRMSQTGSFMGSLPWASPEQADGSARLVDVRSDVYSLGVILYQLLTGEMPYRVDGPLREVLDTIQNVPPRAPREVRRDISDELATIVLKCLSKEPERRYQSAGDLARDIRRSLAGEPIEAKRDSAWYAVRKKLDRYKTAVRAFAVLLVASLLFSVAMVWLRARAVTAEHLAAQRLAEVESAHQAEVRLRTQLQSQVSKNEKVRGFLDSTLRAVDPWKHPGKDLGPLREMLDHAVERLRGAFPDQPQVEAIIAGTLGWDYRELGLYQSAEQLLRRSYELSRDTLGEAHADTLAALNNLATLLTDAGRHAEAGELFERLRGIQEKTLGPEHPATLVTLNDLALDLDWQGRSAEAETIYRKALKAQTARLGEAHPDRLKTLNNLAACLPALGKFEEAERLQQELIRIRTAAFGANDPETLQARANQAVLIIQAGRFSEAEKLLRELLVTLEAKLTSNHPTTIGAMHNLANALSNMGQHDEALALERRAFEAQVAFAGPEHPTTLNRKNDLACTLIEKKKFDEAIPLARQLCEQYERLLGKGDWRTLNAQGNLAFALNKTGDLKQAEIIWNRVISNADPDHEASLAPMVNAQANLAALFSDQGRWSEAEAAFRTAIQTQEEHGQSDHWRTAFMRGGLGRVLLETMQLEEAERLLRTAFAGLHVALGDEHEKSQRVIADLVRLYQKKGDEASMREFQAKERVPGP